MPDNSDYKPKGIDIRIARTKKKKTPDQEPCDWAGCVSKYSIFGSGDVADQTEAPRRRLSRMQLKALNDLGLDETATKEDVNKRYKQLVKQLHPDANQGKRNTEESFQRVVSAHKVLRTTDLG